MENTHHSLCTAFLLITVLNIIEINNMNYDTICFNSQSIQQISRMIRRTVSHISVGTRHSGILTINDVNIGKSDSFSI